MQKFKNKVKSENLEERIKMKEKFSVLFVLLMEVLSGIFVENKTRATLLYRLFKIQFVETEKKWLHIMKEEREKIHFYRDLCKMIIFDHNKENESIAAVTDVIFNNQISFENLERHKKLINYLMRTNNEKKNEIYMLRSKVKTLESELTFWLYGYDDFKNDLETRDMYSSIDTEGIKRNIEKEFSHKKIGKSQIALITCSDVFLALSKQRSYIQEQKLFFKTEIDRLTEESSRLKLKKKAYKDGIKEQEAEVRNLTIKLNTEIENSKNHKLYISNHRETQTEMTDQTINKLIMAKNNLDYLRSYETGKFREAVEKVDAKLSKAEPMDKQELLYLISNIYQEKASEDIRLTMLNKKKLPLDYFLYDTIKNNLKNKKVVRKRCEEIVVSVRRYMRDYLNR